MRGGGGGRNEEWIYTLSNGSAGGMLILEDRVIQTRSRRSWSLFTFRKTLGLQFGDYLVDFHVYMALLQNNGKEEFWIELNNLGNLIEGARCIGGEFKKSSTQKIGTGEEASTPKGGNSMCG